MYMPNYQINMKNYCFITVRSSSSRLKKKCFLKFGSYTIIDHIILRCINFNLIPVICTTQNKNDRNNGANRNLRSNTI